MKFTELKQKVRTQIDEGCYNFIISRIGETEIDFITGETITAIIKMTSSNISIVKNCKNTLKSINEDSFGGVCVSTFLGIILSDISKNNKTSDILNHVKLQYKIILAYLNKEIMKSEFLQGVFATQESLGMSDEFYNGLVDYYGSRTSAIVPAVIAKL